MSEYKRLTRRNKDGTTWVKCSDCDNQDKCDITKESCCNYLQDRIAELEDKIENETLVNIPCKVGCTIYEVFKNHKPPFIQQTKVEKIIVTEKGLKLKLARNSVYETSISSLGNTLFLTKEEAEVKLKELTEVK